MQVTEKDIIEIDCAIRDHEKRDNTFTVSVLQRCRELVLELLHQPKLGSTVYRINEYGKNKIIPLTITALNYNTLENGEVRTQMRCSDIMIEDYRIIGTGEKIYFSEEQAKKELEKKITDIFVKDLQAIGFEKAKAIEKTKFILRELQKEKEN